MAPALPQVRADNSVCGAVSCAAIFDMDGVLIDSRRPSSARVAVPCWPSSATEPPIPSTGASPSAGPAKRRCPLLGRRLSGREARAAGPPQARPLPGARADRARSGGGRAPSSSTTLARDDVPRAVGTSASRWDAERLLDDLGLLRYFDVIVTADDVHAGKPDPEVWTCPRRPACGWRRQRCVVFEDALVGVAGRPHARACARSASPPRTPTPSCSPRARSATIPDFQGLEWTGIAHP